MSITTIYQKQRGDLTAALIEITEGTEGEIGFSRTRSWEVYCELCDSLSAGLTEAEADAELAEHECPSGDEVSHSSEVYCERCDTLFDGLTEAEAAKLARSHRCGEEQ